MCEEFRDLTIFTPAVDTAFKVMWIFIFIAGVLFAVVRWTQPSGQLLLEELIKIVTALLVGIICTSAGVGPIVSKRLRARWCQLDNGKNRRRGHVLSTAIFGIACLTIGVVKAFGLLLIEFK